MKLNSKTFLSLLDAFFTNGINFFSFFIFLYLLGSENLISFVLATTYIGFLQSLLKFGQNEYFVANFQKLPLIIGGLFAYNLILSLFGSLIIILVLYLLYFFSYLGHEAFINFSFATFSLFFAVLTYSYHALFQAKMEFDKIILANISSSIIAIVVCLYFWFFISPQYTPIILLASQSFFKYLICSFLNTFKYELSIKNAYSYFGASIAFIKPLFLARVISSSSKKLDEVLVSSLFGPQNLVAYVIAKKIIIKPLQIIYSAIDRWYFSELQHYSLRDIQKSYYKICKYLGIYALIFLIVIIFVSLIYLEKIQIYLASNSLDNLSLLVLGFCLCMPIVTPQTFGQSVLKTLNRTKIIPLLLIYSLSIPLSIFLGSFFIKFEYTSFLYLFGTLIYSSIYIYYMNKEMKTKTL